MSKLMSKDREKHLSKQVWFLIEKEMIDLHGLVMEEKEQERKTTGIMSYICPSSDEKKLVIPD